MKAVVNVADVLQLLQEPLVNLRQIMYLVDGVSLCHCLCNDEDTLVGRLLQGFVDIFDYKFLVLDETVHSLSDHAQTLLDSLFEGASDGHHLTYALHAAAQLSIHTTELSEVPTGYLTYHIVKSRLKECAGGLCHRVLQLKQAVSQTQLGSYKCQGITCCLAGQCRATAQAGVYLNHTIILALGVKGILHVALTHDTDVTDNLDAQSTQFMILTVGQCL